MAAAKGRATAPTALPATPAATPTLAAVVALAPAPRKNPLAPRLNILLPNAGPAPRPLKAPLKDLDPRKWLAALKAKIGAAILWTTNAATSKGDSTAELTLECQVSWGEVWPKSCQGMSLFMELIMPRLV